MSGPVGDGAGRGTGRGTGRGAGRGAGPGAGARRGLAAGAAADDDALLVRLLTLPEHEQRKVAATLSTGQLAEFHTRFTLWGHRGQRPPPGAWRVWIIRAGRGFGKTRAGAEWVIQTARDLGRGGRIALVGATVEDVRKVMIEGPAGIIERARFDQPVKYSLVSGTVAFAGGATAHVYSAEAPEKLRGPEHHAAWCDELAKWRYGDAAWDNLMLGLRVGEHPRCVVTTTPRPNALMRKVMALRDCVETRGSTYDNPHLPAAFVAAVEAEYAGTRLGRQELDGELVEDAEGALWTRALIEGCRVRRVDRAGLVRVVVGVDPPASATGDACGIVACGVDAAGTGWVLEDASVRGASPDGWARAVAECAARWRAERVVAEKNNGGDMVGAVLQGAVGPGAGRRPVKLVHASRGKAARAEPVAALYERGLVKHARGLGALEDELCGLQAGGGYAGPGTSPDRADACVWALTELMLGKRRGKAGVRAV